MNVDCHAHLVPADLIPALQTAGHDLPSIKLIESGESFQFAFSANAPTRPVMPKLFDLDNRLAWMKSSNIDHQIVGGWLDIFGYELPAQEGLRWSRLMNVHLKQTCDRLSCLTPLATVPLQSGELAAVALAEAMQDGFPGVMIGTQPDGQGGNLDDPALEPFWAAASELEACVFVHPMYGCDDARLEDYGLVNTIGRGVDTTIAIARLLFSGTLQRHPGAKIIISHGGAALPYMLGRLVRNWKISKDDLADPLDGFRRLYFDSVLHDPRALQLLCDHAGPDRIMLGSDYPFPIGDLEPVKIVEQSGLSADTVNSIMGSTAQRIFQLNAPCSC